MVEHDQGRTGRLVITRDWLPVNGRFRRLKVWANGQDVARIGNGETIDIDVPVHRRAGHEPQVRVQVSLSRWRSEEVTVPLEPGGVAHLSCSVTSNPITALDTFRRSGLLHLRSYTPRAAQAVGGATADSVDTAETVTEGAQPARRSLWSWFSFAFTWALTIGVIYALTKPGRLNAGNVAVAVLLGVIATAGTVIRVAEMRSRGARTDRESASRC